MNEAMNSLLPESVQQLPTEQRDGYKNYDIQITFAAFLLGGALGGIVFGTLADRIGRKRAMSYTILMYSAFTCVSALSSAWWHLAGFRFLVAMGVGGEWAMAWVVTHLSQGATGLYCLLPLFGFLTMGMHAGYAIYFPELFPTRLRSTGDGVCFNLGRILAAPILFLAGWMNKDWGYTLANTVSLLAFLYLLGIPVIAAARETKDEDLPE